MADSHNHQHAPAQGFNNAFAVGIGLNLLFIGLEVFYGLRAGSVALLADAGHNGTDVLSLIFSWIAIALAQRKPTGRYTYGLRRATILIALLNALLLFGAVGAIVWEAVQRLGAAVPVAAGSVMAVAAAGVAVNGVTAWLFARGVKADLNIKGAFLHFMADALVSVGVVAAGLLILYTGWLWVDPAISFVIVAVILVSSWGLFRDAINLALDAVPRSIDVAAVHDYLAQLAGVQEVHELHVWGLSTTETALTVHLTMPAHDGNDAFMSQLKSALHERFGIDHTTVQIEQSRQADFVAGAPSPVGLSQD